MEKLAFICQGNAGRSQLATALAERERDRRGMDLPIVTGGVDPGDHVHPEVEEVLAEHDITIERDPRQISADDLADATHVVTMGCDAADLVPVGWDGVTERWELDHPGGDDLAAVRQLRDEIDDRVKELFRQETGEE